MNGPFFPWNASPEALAMLTAAIFELRSHSPLSRAEEAQLDGLTDRACDLAREGFEQLDAVATKWLAKDAQRENVLWLARAAIGGDEDALRDAKSTLCDNFILDCSDAYAEDARIAELDDAEERANC